MNLRMTISVLLAAWLAGCYSSSTTAGTSSEAVTGLQILANSAGAIVSRLPSSRTVAGRTATLAGVVMDSFDSAVMIGRCRGSTETQYLQRGEFWRLSKGNGAGSDGSENSCALDYARSTWREERNDSTGWSVSEGFMTDSGVPYEKNGLPMLAWEEFIGKGSWRLSSGLVLQYDSLYKRTLHTSEVPTVEKYVQRIRFAGTCFVTLEFDHETTLDAPVFCGAAVAGRFTWDFVGAPVVLDAQGQKVIPQRIETSYFAEDSIGLTLSQARMDTTGGVAILRATLGWRLLPGDAIAVGDSVRARIAATGWSGVAVLGKIGVFALPLGVVKAGDVLSLSVVKPGFDANLDVPLPASGAVQVGLAARSMAFSPVVRSGLHRSLR